MQVTEFEKAKQLFKSLEIRTNKSNVDTALRIICIQELLKDLKKR